MQCEAGPGKEPHDAQEMEEEIWREVHIQVAYIYSLCNADPYIPYVTFPFVSVTRIMADPGKEPHDAQEIMFSC